MVIAWVVSVSGEGFCVTAFWHARIRALVRGRAPWATWEVGRRLIQWIRLYTILERVDFRLWIFSLCQILQFWHILLIVNWIAERELLDTLLFIAIYCSCFVIHYVSYNQQWQLWICSLCQILQGIIYWFWHILFIVNWIAKCIAS